MIWERGKLVNREKRNKGEAMEISFLSWWVIGIAILIIMLVAIWIMKDSGEGAINFLKNMLRVGK